MGDSPRDSGGRKRSRVVGAIVWSGVGVGLLVLVCAWMPMVFAASAASGTLGSWFWAVDLVASLSTPMAWLLAASLGISLLFRRFRCAGAYAAIVLGLVLLPISEERLARADGGSQAIGIAIYNSHTRSSEVAEKHAMLQDADADVVVLLETSTSVMRSLKNGEGVRASHPYGWLPPALWSSSPAILSRHPVEAEGTELSGRLRAIRARLWDHLYRMEIVHAPGGSFVVMQAHARSPRRPARWAAGLEQLLEVADFAQEVGEITGLPIVVAGDFNSTPTGVRARAFARRSGLVRAKPAMRLGGTYPSGAPSPFSLAIDGVYASPGVRVVSWEVLGSAGSDHRALRIGLDFSQERGASP